MKYNIDFCIASSIFTAILFAVYASQKKLPSTRTRIFTALLCSCLVGLVGDALAGGINGNLALPKAVHIAANAIYLIAVQLAPLLFLRYVLVIFGVLPKLNKFVRSIVYLPFAVFLFGLVLSFFGKSGIFYIDDMHSYAAGSLYILLFIPSVSYILASIIIVFAKHNDISIRKVLVVVAFTAISIVAMLTQYLLKTVLLNTTAIAVSVVLIYFVLEAPTRFFDARTGAFNKEALQLLLTDLIEQNSEYTLLVFSSNAVPLVRQMIGAENAELAEQTQLKTFENAFPDSYVVAINEKNYVIIIPDKNLLRGDFHELVSLLPKTIKTDKFEVAVRISAACVPKGYCKAVAEINSIIGHLLTLQQRDRTLTELYVDGGVLRKRKYEEDCEVALERAIAGGTLETFYQPICKDGKVYAFEALARLNDEKLGPIPPEVFIKIAEENGTIFEVGEIMLKNVCNFVRDNDLRTYGIDHISINLSMIQLALPNLSDSILATIANYNIPNDFLCFEITESQLASDVPDVAENIRKLTEHNFRFLLDDFGTGYANFMNLASLPIQCVKLDKSLLWTAMRDEADRKLLQGIVKIIDELHLDCICEGVETTEHIELLSKLGVNRHQGFYFSRALPASEILKYLSING